MANDSELSKAIASEVSKLTLPAFTDKCWNLVAQSAKAMIFRKPYYGYFGRILRPLTERHQLLEPELDFSRIHPHQAAIALRQMERLGRILAVQRRNSLRLASLLSGLKGVAVPRERPAARYNFHHFPVLVASRQIKQLVTKNMLSLDVDTSQMYADIASQARTMGYEGDCPISESVAERMLTIPNHAFLSNGDVEHIAQSFRRSVDACLPMGSEVPAAVAELRMNQRQPE